MTDDDMISSYEALMAAFEPRRALLTLSHAVRTHRLRAAGKALAPTSYAFRVFRHDEGR